MTTPITSALHPKVLAAGAGAGAGVTIAAALDWLLGVTVWHAPNTQAGAEAAMAAVPYPIAALILLGVTALGALLGGWLKRTDPSVVQNGTFIAQAISGTEMGEKLREFLEAEMAKLSAALASSTASSTPVDEPSADPAPTAEPSQSSATTTTSTGTSADSGVVSPGDMDAELAKLNPTDTPEAAS